MEKNQFEEFIKKQIEKLGYSIYSNVIVKRPDKFRRHPDYRCFSRTEIDNLVINRDIILVCECKVRKGVSYYNSSWGPLQQEIFKRINKKRTNNFFQCYNYISSNIFYNGENVTKDLIGQIRRQVDFLKGQKIASGKTIIPIIVTNRAIKVRKFFKRDCIIQGVWVMQTSFFINNFLPLFKEIGDFKEINKTNC